MPESLSTFSFKKLPGAFIGALSFILLLECAALPLFVKSFPALIYQRTSRIGDDVIRFELQILMNAGKTKTIYLMGSSQPRDDVDAQQINERLKVEGYGDYTFINVSSSAADAIDLFLQWDKVAAQNPDIVIATPYRISFYVEAYDPIRFKRYLFSVSRLMELSKFYGQALFWTDLKHDWRGIMDVLILPVGRYERFAVKKVRDFFSRLIGNDSLWPNFTEPKGEEYFKEEIARRLDPSAYNYSFGIYTNVQKSVYRRFSEEVLEQGSLFAVVEYPINPRVLPLEERFGLFWKDYSLFMKQEAARLGYDYFDLKNPAAIDQSDFVDFTHLNAQGRKKFTDLFFEEVLVPQLRHLKTAQKRGSV